MINCTTCIHWKKQSVDGKRRFTKACTAPLPDWTEEVDGSASFPLDNGKYCTAWAKHYFCAICGEIVRYYDLMSDLPPLCFKCSDFIYNGHNKKKIPAHVRNGDKRGLEKVR